MNLQDLASKKIPLIQIVNSGLLHPDMPPSLHQSIVEEMTIDRYIKEQEDDNANLDVFRQIVELASWKDLLIPYYLDAGDELDALRKLRHDINTLTQLNGRCINYGDNNFIFAWSGRCLLAAPFYGLISTQDEYNLSQALKFVLDAMKKFGIKSTLIPSDGLGKVHEMKARHRQVYDQIACNSIDLWDCMSKCVIELSVEEDRIDFTVDPFKQGIREMTVIGNYLYACDPYKTYCINKEDALRYLKAFVIDGRPLKYRYI